MEDKASSSYLKVTIPFLFCNIFLSNICFFGNNVLYLNWENAFMEIRVLIGSALG